jgi:hypothetical protein
MRADNMMKLLVAAAMMFGAAVVPSRAFAEEPEKLGDAELDQVTGGGMPFQYGGHHGHHHGWENHRASTPTVIGTQVIVVIKDVTLIFNVGSNSSVNFATALQLAIASQQPQAASATAAQQGSGRHH